MQLPLYTLCRTVATLLVAAVLAHAGLAQAAGERLRIGGGNNFPPYEYLDEQGRPAGFNVDLARAIGRALDVEVEIRLADWASARDALVRGEFDALQGMFQTEERARAFDFTLPHSMVSHAILSLPGTAQVRTFADLVGREHVAVHRASIMHDYLIARGAGQDVVLAATPLDALRAVAERKCEYAVLPLVPAIYLMREHDLPRMNSVIPEGATFAYGFAVNKGNTRTLAMINEGLAVLRKTGEYQTIRERWLGPYEREQASWKLIARYGLIILGPLVLLLGIVALWSKMLYRQVALRTADLTREVAARRLAEEELKRNQQQLIQADKLAALGTLVAGVAHEINNPNATVLMNVPLVRRMVSEMASDFDALQHQRGELEVAGMPWQELREALPRLLEDTESSAQRIRRIVNDLKDFARTDPGQMGPVAFDEVLGAALRLVEPRVRRATEHLTLQPCTQPLPVHGNFQRLEQVVVNLLLNACEALPDATRGVNVSTARDDAAGEVVLVVSDQGVGVPVENLTRLTDPFFTTKRDQGGTGLGLSISLGIVRGHGGRLEIASEPAGGTRVTVRLPLADKGLA